MNKDILHLPVWAVVGANDNPAKFGCKIYKFMKKAGYFFIPDSWSYLLGSSLPYIFYKKLTG